MISMFYSIKYFGGGVGNSYYAQLLTFLLSFEMFTK